MANEKNTVKKETGSGVAPFLIIGGIFLATILGIWWISQSGGDGGGNTAQTNSATQTAQTQDGRIANYNQAPAGATPANFKGAANSPVVIEEFADFQCPTCAVVHPKMNEISAKYGNRVKFIYRHFPITQIHPNAYGAAVAAEAAGLQGKFWQMQDLLFRNQTQWSNAQNASELFKEYAGRIGLNVEQFENDLRGVQAKQRVDFDIERARALNINSTPTVLVNGAPVPFQQMEVDGMSRIIEAELAKYEQPQTPAGQTDSSAPAGNSANSANSAENASGDGANKNTGGGGTSNSGNGNTGNR